MIPHQVDVWHIKISEGKTYQAGEGGAYRTILMPNYLDEHLSNFASKVFFSSFSVKFVYIQNLKC